MTRRFVVALFCVAFVLILTLTSAVAQKNEILNRQAPGFTLSGLDGSSVRFSDYRGKVILLDFWATWCAPCQTEVPRFVDFQNKFGAQGFQVIGISMDDSSIPVRKFYAKFKMNYPVAMGTEQLARTYGGVLGLPLTFLIGRDGQVLKKYESSADLDQMERDIAALLTPTPK